MMNSIRSLKEKSAMLKNRKGLIAIDTEAIDIAIAKSKTRLMRKTCQRLSTQSMSLCCIMIHSHPLLTCPMLRKAFYLRTLLSRSSAPNVLTDTIIVAKRAVATLRETKLPMRQATPLLMINIVSTRNTSSSWCSMMTLSQWHI